MNNKKIFRGYLVIALIVLVAALLSGILGFLETGVSRIILIIVSLVLLVCSIAFFSLYRYFLNRMKNSPKGAREEQIMNSLD
jgi:uncharacterized membrane-anchored protein